MGISQRIAAMAAVAVLLGAVASCSAAGLTPGDQGPAGPAPAAHGPAVTLRVAVYGAPGYRQAGLFAAYERLHPGVRIVEDTTAQEPGYWQGLQRHLATGRGLGDLVAIPMTQMSNVLGRFQRLGACRGAGTASDGPFGLMKVSWHGRALDTRPLPGMKLSPARWPLRAPGSAQHRGSGRLSGSS